jgi:hypothetical protein
MDPYRSDLESPGTIYQRLPLTFLGTNKNSAMPVRCIPLLVEIWIEPKKCNFQVRRRLRSQRARLSSYDSGGILQPSGLTFGNFKRAFINKGLLDQDAYQKEQNTEVKKTFLEKSMAVKKIDITMCAKALLPQKNPEIGVVPIGNVNCFMRQAPSPNTVGTSDSRKRTSKRIQKKNGADSQEGPRSKWTV